MSKLLTAIILILISIPIFSQSKLSVNKGQSTSILQSQRAKKVDEIIAKYHEYNLFNGSVLIFKDGKELLKKSYGKANLTWNIDATAETKFRIGSITKQFTAMLIMQLKQEGKIKLEGKLSDYLPWYNQTVGSKITIHNLLTHTSGLPNYTSSPNFPNQMAKENLSPKDFAVKYFQDTLEFEPGKDIRYSNTGYYLLGLIIEEITKKPYEIVLQERIFDVLGMKNTGIETPYRIIANFAEGYELDFDGFEKADFINMKTATYSAGAMFSTVEDLLLWDTALYTNILLNEENKRIMFTPFLPNYAYGIAVLKKKNFLGLNKDITQILHGGGIQGFSSFMTRIPEDKILIVLLDNTRAGTRGGELESIVENIIPVIYDLKADLPQPLAVFELYKLLKTKSLAQAITQFKETKNINKNAYNFRNFESDLNRLGYKFLLEKKISSAIEILRLCVEEFPNSANAYDSLGEAYLENRDYELAIANYEKSLQLDSNNENAKLMIQKIKERKQ